MKKIIAILLLFLAVISCERDDICAESTATTPHLVIDFYDYTEQNDTKNVVDLRVEGLNDNDEVYSIFQEAASSGSISIPLKTIDNDDDTENGITTRFRLYKEYEEDDNGNITAGNPDILSFTYTTEDVYVSRACGYKTIFNNVEMNLDVDDDNWIQLYEYEIPLTVENETTTHIQIFH